MCFKEHTLKVYYIVYHYKPIYRPIQGVISEIVNKHTGIRTSQPLTSFMISFSLSKAAL